MSDMDRHIANRVLLGGLAGFVAASAALILGSFVEADVSAVLAMKGYWFIIGIAIFAADRAYVHFRMSKSKGAAPHG